MNDFFVDICFSEALADFRVAEHTQLGRINVQKRQVTALTVTRVSGTPHAPGSLKTKVVLTEEGNDLWEVLAEE
jgi:hypothetical protein